MSTKTTIKRIALVAAVAAAFGGLSTVASQAAITGALTTQSASNPATGSLGTPVTVSFTETATAAAAADTFTMTPTISAPTNSSVGNQSITVVPASLTNATQVVTASTGTGVSPVVTDTVVAAATSAAYSVTNNYTFTPDVPGNYVVTVNSAASTTVVVTSTTPQFLNHAEDSQVIGVSASTGNAITAVSGGFATVAIEANNTTATQYITVSGGTVLSAVATTGNNGTTGSTTLNNGSGATANTTDGYALPLAWTAHNSTDVLLLAVQSTSAGVVTITDTPVTQATGIPGTPVVGTVTFGAAPVVSAQYSTAYIADGTTAATAASQATSLLSYSKSATGAVANIVVTTNSAASTAINGTGLSVSVSGPGSVGVGITANPAVAGRSVSVSATTAASSSVYYVNVYADGTAGTSTITLTAGTTVLATKTVTFTGTPAKATATQNLFIAAPGAALGANPSTYLLEAGVVGNGKADPGADSATSGTAAIVGNVVDANGNPVAGATVKLVSSNTAVITAGSCLEVTNGTYAAPGTWQCQVSGSSGALSGQTATVTFEVYDSATAAYDITAAPLTFAIGKSTVVSEALTTDASSYSALAPMVITVTAKDSAGNLVADQDATPLITLISSTQLGGTLASPTKLVNGIGKIKTAYAPSVAGSFTISAVDNLSVAGEAVSVTAASAGGSADTQAAAATDAANEATDAANAATDAANAAADAADAATAAAQDAGAKADAALAAVTALSAKITVLAAQIAKIVKKLGA